MKIGIITHINIPNYGCFLQCYALSSFLKKSYPSAEVQIVNYIKPSHTRMYYSIECHENFKFWFINPKFYCDLLTRLINRKEIFSARKFLDFYKQYLPMTKEYSSDSIKLEKFDYLLFGSDILWDYTPSFFGHDSIPFGNDLVANHKISYAASFGSVKKNFNHPSYVKKGLLDFDYFSVRDKNSANIVHNLTGKDAKIVADPSLIWDFCNDQHISKEKHFPNYIAIYGGSEFTKEQIIYLKSLSKQLNLKLLNVGGTKSDSPWCDDYINYENLDPFTWCTYIRDSYAVATSAFHGLMFSIVFEKKIMFNATPFMRDKSTTILEYLGLKEILIDNQNFEKQLNWNWDYNFINKKIEIIKQESYQYISQALSF